MNWIIGGTDAHAKNFSMLVGTGERARLAPICDVASSLPYDFDPGKSKMATKIGGRYRPGEVLSRHWARYASEARLPFEKVLRKGKAMADAVPVALDETINEAQAGGLEHPVMAVMMDVLSTRSEECARILSGAPN